MKRLIQALSLLFAICLTTSLYAQDIDTICVSTDKYKNVLKWAYYGMECDSIVEVYQFKDTLKSDIIEAQHDQIILDQKILGEYKVINSRLKLTSVGLFGISALLLVLLLTVK